MLWWLHCSLARYVAAWDRTRNWLSGDGAHTHTHNKWQNVEPSLPLGLWSSSTKFSSAGSMPSVPHFYPTPFKQNGNLWMPAFWKSRTKPKSRQRSQSFCTFTCLRCTINWVERVFSFIFHLQQFESEQKVCLFYDDSFALVNSGIWIINSAEVYYILLA